jgi:FSR family fosmidomycin resistance protein-like MFS transporter
LYIRSSCRKEIRNSRKIRLLKRLNSGSRMIVALSLAHFANDAPFTLLPAVLPLVMKDFDLSYAAAGAIITLSTVLMASLQAVSGYVADRTNRITFLFMGLSTLSIGTILVSFSTNYIQLLAFQCLAGIGASIYHPIGYSLLSDVFESGNRGKILGLGSASGDMAVPVAFASSGFLALVLGWRNIFRVWGLVTAIVAIIMPLILTEPRKGKLYSITSRSVKKVATTLIPTIIVMGLAGACYRIICSFTTTYLTTFGLSIELANIVTALMMIIGAVGAVVEGTLADKLGERSIILFTMVMLSALSAISANVGNVFLVSIIICISGFALLGVWPPLYSVIAGFTSLGARAFIYGLVFAIAWGFGSPFPYISGFCADIFGLQVIYIIVSFISLVAAIITRLTH